MARKPYRKHKVALRRSHMQYQWKTVAAAVLAWGRRAFFFALSVWLISTGYAFWTASEWLRVQSVRVDPQAPAGLAARLEVAAGDHLFAFSARRAEARLKKEFPELSALRVTRGWDRGVDVRVERRVPVARVQEGEVLRGMDENGVVFPVEGGAEGLIILAGVGHGAAAAPALDFVKRLRETGVPWVRRLFKVKMTPQDDATLFLQDNVPVSWGPAYEDDAVLRRKARRLGRVLGDETLAAGAEYIRFVDESRIAAKPLAIERSGDGKTK